MHVEVIQFLRNTRDKVTWKGANVVEVGAQDVNGQTRKFCREYKSWTGIDLVAGPGVDHVGDAAAILSRTEHVAHYDIAVSTEVLEHARNWKDIVWRMCNSLKQGGFLVITCAGTGRDPHGACGGGLPEGEYYRNVSVPDLLLEIPSWMDIVWTEEGPPGDSRLVATRRIG